MWYSWKIFQADLMIIGCFLTSYNLIKQQSVLFEFTSTTLQVQIHYAAKEEISQIVMQKKEMLVPPWNINISLLSPSSDPLKQPNRKFQTRPHTVWAERADSVPSLRRSLVWSSIVRANRSVFLSQRKVYCTVFCCTDTFLVLQWTKCATVYLNRAGACGLDWRARVWRASLPCGCALPRLRWNLSIFYGNAGKRLPPPPPRALVVLFCLSCPFPDRGVPSCVPCGGLCSWVCLNMVYGFAFGKPPAALVHESSCDVFLSKIFISSLNKRWSIESTAVSDWDVSQGGFNHL